MITNMGLKVQLASCVTMGILLCCIVSMKLLSGSHDALHMQTIENNNELPRNILPPQEPTVPKHVRELLEATRAATRAAAGGVEESLIWTEQQRAEWELSHPCRSRMELKPMYARRKRVKDMADNSLWDMVLQEYSKLHRTCMQRVGQDLKQGFMERNSSVGCKFAVADIDWSIPAGLSNRILSVTSVALYAILTQRVLLVPRSTLVTTLMCEPFPGSSWEIDSYGDFSWYPWAEEAKHIWAFHKDVYGELDDKMVNHTSSYFSSPLSTFFAASMDLSQYHPDNRFFCDTEQASFRGITWLFFTGCIYTIPKFFAIPSFRPTLDALFPGRFVLTQMLRSVMLPADSVWEEVLHTEANHFKNAGHRVGIQIRYYYGKPQYLEMNDIVNERIMACAIDNGIFPARTLQPRKLLEEQQSVQVFIASLYTGFLDHMSNVYLSYPPASGEIVDVIQLSNNSFQQFGVAVDTQSLVEIFLLSFSDTLLNTPISTFGGLSQAYGSLTPWKIETRNGSDLAPCERDRTVDLCYQTADFKYSCAYNNVNGLSIGDLAPYFQTCLENFTQVGVQLITDHSTPTHGRHRVDIVDTVLS